MVVLGMVLGVFIARDYGLGWDGLFQYRLGEANYKIYQHPFASRTEGGYGPFSHEYHGPFYQMVAYGVSNLYTRFFAETFRYEAFFYADYLVYLLGVLSLYLLCKRYLKPWWALFTALLYATQPLLFGHAFINPKDTPFLGLMLFSVYTGMYMVDHFLADLPEHGARFWPWLNFQWQDLQLQKRRRLKCAAVIWLLLLLLTVLFSAVIESLASQVAAALLQADPASLPGNLVQDVAPNIGNQPLVNYQQRAVELVFKVLRWFFLIWIVLLAWIGVKALAVGREKRQFVETLWKKLKAERWASLALAGAALGLTTATRALALLAAGGLVALYAVLRLRWKSLQPLLTYFGVAAVSLYAAWPYLWPAPFSRYFAALTTLSAFPWPGSILYRGEMFLSSALPRDYLPRLISLQFTEPVVLLALPGMAMIIVAVFKRQKTAEYLIPLVWFWLPFLGVLILQPNMYDNFRHFLFISPPLFIFAGMAMAKTAKWLKREWLGYALALIALLPGIIHIIQLHPYQYIYFNQFTAGVQGAFRQYELDYWATSTKESFAYLNQQAEPLARVVVWGPESTSRLYAREDLDLVFADELDDDLDLGWYDYAVLSTRTNRDLLNVPNAPELFRVEREGATLMVVRQLGSP